jgi:hypothetical protein
MKLIETYEVIDATGESVEWVKLERATDEFTWMPKSEYDRQQAEQSTPMVTDETKTI